MGRVGMETKHVFGGFVMTFAYDQKATIQPALCTVPYNEWEVEVFCPYELR